MCIRDSSITAIPPLLILRFLSGKIFLISTLVIASCTVNEEGNYISFNDKELIPNEKNITSHSIIQPGAPGEDSKTLDPVEATNIASTSYVQADVDFLQAMIVHHQQAILMSELSAERTNNQTILDLADRIDISQEDEIDFMENWLESRGENINLSSHEHMQEHKHMKMAGMASSEELKELRASKSTSFDKLFLQLMINHHDGALEMVETLKEFPGNSFDSSLDEFISELINDQGVEIERMNGILVNLSDDPRSNLEPGLYDAGESIQNLKLITSLKKPIGFFDPENPEGKGIKRIEKDSKKDEKVRTIEEMSSSLRWPILSFASTDMAFRDNILVAGSYHGFNIYEIQTDGIPSLISSVVCPGGQGDVSIVGDILIMSLSLIHISEPTRPY